MSNALKRIVPLLDRVLVKRALTPDQTKQGIMLPEKSLPKKLEGTVIAVGPGVHNVENGEHIPLVLQPGDRVLLPGHGGTKVDVGDTDDKAEYLMFRESDILAKLEKDA